MVNEKILLAKEALIEQTNRPISVDSTWVDLGLDSIDILNTIFSVEDKIGREINYTTIQKYFYSCGKAIAQLIHMMEETESQ
jgi:acyl carrier protein